MDDKQPSSDVVTLNVGGKIFATTLSTLNKMPQSMIGAMFSGEFTAAKDANGHVFIDNDGSAFHVVLNFLRHRQLVVSDVELSQLHPQLLFDAEYYCLPELQSAVQQRMKALADKDKANCGKSVCESIDELRGELTQKMKTLTSAVASPSESAGVETISPNQLKQMHAKLIEAIEEVGDDVAGAIARKRQTSV